MFPQKFVYDGTPGSDAAASYGLLRIWESGEFTDKQFLRQRMSLLAQMSTTPIDCLFKLIASGNQEEVERLLCQAENDEDTVQKMCHPLCSCDCCEKLISGKLNDPSIVTPFSRDDRGYTPLHIAAICGQAPLVDLLIFKGAAVNATDYHGSTPLHLACQKGYQDVTLLLLHYKANTDAQDNNGNTPLHLACTYGHEDCVKALVYYDVHTCRFDIGNEKGDTALHIAARWGYQGIIEVLLQNGANTDIKNRMKETPMHCALNPKILSLIQSNRIEVESRQSTSESPRRSPQLSVETFSRGSSVSSLSSSSVDPKQDEAKNHLKEAEKLLRAVADGDLEMVRYLFEWVDEDFDETEEAIKTENIEFCHPLCQCAKCAPAQKMFTRVRANGLGVNVANQDGFTPLHVAAQHGHPVLVSLLVKHGANISAKNVNRAVPLHLACQGGNLQVVKCLLDCSAKANKKDINGSTPLMYSCSSGQREIAALLLEHGASVNISNNKGSTPLHEAVKKKHDVLVDVLLQHGALVYVWNKQQRTPMDYAEENSKIMKQLQTATIIVPSVPVDDPVRANGQKQTFKIRKKTSSSTRQKMATDELQRKRAHLLRSINQFHKADSLRKTITRDRSIPNFDEHVVHQLNIRRFDKSKLRHIEHAKEMRDDTNNNAKPTNDNCGCEDDVAEIARRTKLMHRSNTVNVSCALETAGNASDSIDIFDCTDPGSPLSEQSYDDLVDIDTEHAEVHRKCSLDLEFTLSVLDIQAEYMCQEPTQEDTVQALDCK